MIFSRCRSIIEIIWRYGDDAVKNLTYEELEYYLNQIPGVVVIDMNGIITYVNEQCVDYFGVEKQDAMNRHIKDVFPDTKMLDALKKCDAPEVVYYNSYLGIGISVHIPLFKNGKKIGLLEYDVSQASNHLYDLSKGFSEFLDETLLDLNKEMTGFGDAKYSIDSIVGKSAAVTLLKQEIIAAAKSNSTVIITGETGTGKELVANAIHSISDRKNERLIKVNSSAFPENLVESELFGYEEGSFTGAVKGGKKGKFEQANKGTLFIDEINQMPISVQPKLLRVLQEREIDRIGSDVSIPIDVRIIAASNQNLEELVEQGKFREDLFYRLNVFPIRIPPLRERLEDLDILIQSKIKSLNIELGKSVTKVDDAVLHQFRQYDWPGNIRELHNKIERAMNFIRGDEDILCLHHFNRASQDTSLDLNGLSLLENPIEEVKKDAERKLIREVLKRFDGNKTKAAEYLNISRPLLYQKMNRLDIK